MNNGILTLSDQTLKLLQTKHPKAKAANTEALLHGPKKSNQSRAKLKGVGGANGAKVFFQILVNNCVY